MDGVVDPAFAITMGKLGGLAVLNLEGIQTRYADQAPQLDAIASFDKEEATFKMQQIYAAEDVKADLVTKRVKEIKDGGVLAAASLTPQNVERFIGPAMDGGLDILIIQGTVVSAQHVSSYDKPLDLNAFVEALEIPCIIGGCCSYQGALQHPPMMHGISSASTNALRSSRLVVARDVLGRDDRSLDDEDVRAAVHGRADEPFDVLRCE